MGPPSAQNRITDVHIHIQPWRALKPKVQEAMRKGKEDHWEFLISLMDDPRALLEVMDKSGVWRGTAMKDGHKGKVSVDYQGNVN